MTPDQLDALIRFVEAAADKAVAEAKADYYGYETKRMREAEAELRESFEDAE